MSDNAATSAAAQESEIIQRSAHNANAEAQAVAIVQGVLNTENNDAAIAELIPLQRVLHAIFGLTWTQCAAVDADIYEYFV